MRMMLLAAPVLIAAGLASVPAQAQSFSGSAFVPNDSTDWSARNERGRHDRRDRWDRRRHGRGGTVVIGDLGWNDGWALYNNRSWESDSYNDWWHDRPERSYSRWMMNNQNCERQWWSGGGWRC